MATTVRRHLNRLRRAAALLGPRAIAERLRFHARLVERNEQLIQQVDTLASAMRSLAEQLETVGRREKQLRSILQADVTADASILRFQAMLDETALEQHLQKAIRRARLSVEPFPYCVVDGLFPRSYYNALVDAIPPVELFGDRAVNKQQLLVPFNFAPKYSMAVWAHMADVAATAILVPLLIEKFREPLTEWLRRSFPALGDDPLRAIEMKCSDGRVLLRRPGYRILPHRDPKWGFITCLIYLARPGDDARWGTQLFRVRDDGEAEGGSPHWVSQEQCEWVADVEFLPNRALIFLNSAGAHGAQIPADAQPPDLERYAYQFRVGPERQSMEAIRSTLSAAQQPLWAGKATTY